MVVPLASVLESVSGGGAVLECIRQAREAVVERKKAKTRAALQLIGKQFRLDLDSAVVQAALNFAAAWKKKATTKEGDLREWIEYLEYFRGLARGSLSSCVSRRWAPHSRST